MRPKLPSAWDAIELFRGLVATLLALTAFAAAILFGYENDRASADLGQELLLIDHVLNGVCISGELLTDAQRTGDQARQCKVGTLVRDVLQNQQDSAEASPVYTGASRLFGLWLFDWKIESLSEREHALWLQSVRLREFIDTQRRLATVAQDQAPRFFFLYTNLDRLLQRRPDRHGVLFSSMLYKDDGNGSAEEGKNVKRIGAGVAVSTWFFSRELQTFRADTIEAAVVDEARKNGHSSKIAPEAYAALTAAVARLTVTIPVVNMQLPPNAAAFAIVIFGLLLQVYTLKQLKELARLYVVGPAKPLHAA